MERRCYKVYEKFKLLIDENIGCFESNVSIRYKTTIFYENVNMFYKQLKKPGKRYKKSIEYLS